MVGYPRNPWSGFRNLPAVAGNASPSGATLQELLSAFGVFAFRVSLIINKLPWTSRFRGE